MKKRKISKSGYKGVYKEKNSKGYRFSSYLSSDPYISHERHIEYGFKTAQEAYEAKIAYETKIKNEKETSYNRNRIGYLANKYLQWRKGSVKLSTFRHDEDYLRKYLIVPYATLTIEEFCRNSSLDNFRQKIINSKNSTVYKNRIFKKIQEVFNYGSLINYIKPEYANQVTIKTQKILVLDKKEKKDNYWTPEEWHKFLSTFKKNDKWLIFFTVFGQLGCRIGEIRGLMNKHVYDDSHSIRIEQQAQTGVAHHMTIITTPKTKSSIRTVSISKAIFKRLKEYMEVYNCKDPKNYLFFNRVTPLGLNTIRRKFNEHLKIAKLKRITIHGIRHSNCTWLLSGDLTVQEIAQVSRRLGHSSTKMTLDIYMHIHEKESGVIEEKLDKIF